MKYLKIELNKGFYWNGNGYSEIDKINKEDILNLVNLAEKEDFELDEYNESNIANKAHQIIYENIYSKFSQFLENKGQFKREVDETYRDAIGKYPTESEYKITEEDFGVEDVEEEIRVENIPF